jgi:spore germination protein GerM
MMGVKVQRMGKRLIAIAFVVTALVLGALMLQKYYQAKYRLPASPVAVETVGTQVVTLFFASPDHAGLIRESRDIEACSELAECISAALQELVNGPMGELKATLPPDTTIRSVQVNADLAVIDLGRELQDGLPEDRSTELAAVYSMVNTVTVNFPAIKKVQFLLEGSAVATLKGHSALAGPLGPDLKMEKR